MACRPKGESSLAAFSQVRAPQRKAVPFFKTHVEKMQFYSQMIAFLHEKHLFQLADRAELCYTHITERDKQTQYFGGVSDGKCSCSPAAKKPLPENRAEGSAEVSAVPAAAAPGLHFYFSLWLHRLTRAHSPLSCAMDK